MGKTQEVFGNEASERLKLALLFNTVEAVVLVQPFESVAVTVYVPAARPVRSSVVAPVDHR